jgi:autophagy-related protein 11
MIQICRAEDGEVFQTNATLWEIERLGSLESFLHKEIGIEESAALAYLSDGRRLRTDNVRDLAGAQDQVRASPLPSALLSLCLFTYPPCA